MDKLKVIIPWLLVFLLGTLALPIGLFAPGVIGDIQYRQRTADLPEYRLMREMETKFPDVTLVKVSEGSEYVVVDIYLNRPFRGAKFVVLLSEIVDLTAEYFAKELYCVVIVEPYKVVTTEGPAWAIVEMDIYGISADHRSHLAQLAAEYTQADSADKAQAIVNEVMRYVIYDTVRSIGGTLITTSILERPRGYIWAWE